MAKSEQPVAIITGGGTGVGRDTSLQLARRGYHIILNYSRSKQEAEQTADEITTIGRSTGSQALCLQANVADDQDCRQLIDAALNRHGRLDVLVNCAGTTQFIPFERMEEVSAETWERLFRVNVTGAFQCARAAAPALRKSDNGQIINISSVAAQLGQGSSIPYCCTKAALDNLTVSLARTLAPEIRVNGIAPGFIAGRWTEKGLGVSYDQVCKAYEQSLPLRKVCQPADIAEAIVSLITGSRLVTGQTLTVDAGMMIAGYQVSYDDALQQANAADPANRR